MRPASHRAFEGRVATLRGEWSVFARNGEARLWVLNIAPDERSMVDAFIELESSENGSTHDLFVRFDAPFDAAPSYGQALLGSLAEQMAATGDELGFAWLPPPKDKRADTCVAFMAACNALASQLEDLAEHIAIVLTPSVIADVNAWLGWLRTATGMAGERVRLVVVDDVRRPALSELATMTSASARVVVCTPRLDMGAAMSSVARSTPPGPDAEFRRHMLALVAAAEARDVPGAQSAADEALALADKCGWHVLGVAVHLVLASVRVAEGHFEAAIADHRQAQAVLARMTEHPSHPRMQLTVELGLASTLVAVQALAEAGATYERAAAMAAALEDAAMELDCWRMASHCQEQLRAPAQAWKLAHKGIEVAEHIDPKTRPASTLAHLGGALMRLCERKEFAGHARRIEARMVELTGRTDWRACVPSGTSPAEATA